MDKDCSTARGSRLEPSVFSASDPAATSARILDLANELTTIAGQLSKVQHVAIRPPDEPKTLLLHLKILVKKRRLREQLISAELFADPAWDILLDLTIARLGGVPVAVSSLCIAANVPTTTALRWVGRLLDDGIVNRAMDPADRRRTFIRLSDDMYDKMIAFAKATLPSG